MNLKHNITHKVQWREKNCQHSKTLHFSTGTLTHICIYMSLQLCHTSWTKQRCCLCTMGDRAAQVLLTHMHKCLRTACVHTSMIYKDAYAPTVAVAQNMPKWQPKQYLTPVAEMLFSLKGLMETFTPMKLCFVSIQRGPVINKHDFGEEHVTVICMFQKWKTLIL